MRRLALYVSFLVIVGWLTPALADDSEGGSSDDGDSERSDFAATPEFVSPFPIASITADNVTLEITPVKANLSISF
ncbi:MAG: hypothetical protein HY465_03975 [Deltaproteobacteria bacterium]|nr:hypothetical protein [Deltaproteobacteria bacterium]